LLQHPSSLPDGQPGPWALPGEGSEHRARFIQAVAHKRQPLDLQAVAGLEPLSEQRVVGFFVEEIAVRGRRLALLAAVARVVKVRDVVKTI